MKSFVCLKILVDTDSFVEWLKGLCNDLLFFFLADRYCKLLVDEGGVQLLQEITNSTQCSENLEKNAAMILNKIAVAVGNVVPMEIDQSRS